MSLPITPGRLNAARVGQATASQAPAVSGSPSQSGSGPVADARGPERLRGGARHGVPAAGRIERRAPAKVDLHAASIDELAGLPGIGPKLAAEIARRRSWAGRNFGLAELATIPGIGQAKVDSMRALIDVRPLDQPIQRTFFLEGFAYGNTDSETDLYLTEHDLGTPKMARRQAAGRIAPQRFLSITDPMIMPGGGSGTLVLGGREMKITYAWRGRGDSYTVRMRTADGKPLGDTVANLRDQIVRFEHGGQLETATTMTRAEYLEKQYGIAGNSLEALRAELLRRNRELGERLAKLLPDLAKDFDAVAMTERTIRELKGKRLITISHLRGLLMAPGGIIRARGP